MKAADAAPPLASFAEITLLRAKGLFRQISLYGHCCDDAEAYSRR